MNSSSKPERGPICSNGPFAGGFQFQSSQPHLKRFIMFDHSGGKGRVFFHPALAHELFGPAEAHGYEIQGFAADKVVATDQLSLNARQSNVNLLTYKQMVEGAFTSLQSVRSSRQNETACLQQQRVRESYTSSWKPKVFEAIAVKDDSLACGIEAGAEQCIVSNPLVCEEILKVSASLPSVQVAGSGCFSVSSGTQNGSTKHVRMASGMSHEDTEDLDALLSSEEEDDDDVRSTGHSPDESLGKVERNGGDEGEEVEQYPSKRRKVAEKTLVRISETCAGDAVMNRPSRNRKQKIKRTVKALQRMIPGGHLLDATLVLDETIRYVKSLRDRVNQLEASRIQSQLLNHHP